MTDATWCTWGTKARAIVLPHVPNRFARMMLITNMVPVSRMSVRRSICCFQRRNIQAAPLAWKSHRTNVYQLLNHTQMNGEDLQQTLWGGKKLWCVSTLYAIPEASDFELTNSCIGYWTLRLQYLVGRRAIQRWLWLELSVQYGLVRIPNSSLVPLANKSLCSTSPGYVPNAQIVCRNPACVGCEFWVSSTRGRAFW